MIRGSRKIKLTPASILEKISAYDIFRRYMPDTFWKIDHITLSPFRNEKNPSFIIGNRNGVLKFMDFANTSLHGDCFSFVKMLYNLTLDEALIKIDTDFGLGISHKGANVGEYKQIIAEYKQPEELGKRYALIQVITRKFTKAELDYWAEYHQGIDDLRTNHIYSLKSVFLNKSKFNMKDEELRFGYLYNGHWKIYRPYGDKNNKWVPNNVPIFTMEGLENIKGQDFAFITKSKKDYMVLRKVLKPVCATQNEGVACFSDENIYILKNETPKQILSYDSDPPGVKNSLQITKTLGFDYCNIPKVYLKENIKDWADLVKAHGYKPIEDILKKKGVL